jgi:hypothetical protein
MKTLRPWATHRLLMATAFALLFVMNTHAAAEKTLFDFQTATNTAAWQVVNDDVMGGVSTSSFRLTNGAAVFQGELSLENNGGFASVRSLPASHDLSGCDTFVIRVRGDGRRYKFTARDQSQLRQRDLPERFHDNEGPMGGAPAADEELRADVPRPRVIRCTAAGSHQRHLRRVPHFRQAGWPIWSGGGVDQGGAALMHGQGQGVANEGAPESTHSFLVHFNFHFNLTLERHTIQACMV